MTETEKAIVSEFLDRGLRVELSDVSGRQKSDGDYFHVEATNLMVEGMFLRSALEDLVDSGAKSVEELVDECFEEMEVINLKIGGTK